MLDPTGSKYCGITLEWDYKNRTVDLSMPKYVPTNLKDFGQLNPLIPQHAPYKAPPFFSNSQNLYLSMTHPNYQKNARNVYNISYNISYIMDKQLTKL